MKRTLCLLCLLALLVGCTAPLSSDAPQQPTDDAGQNPVQAVTFCLTQEVHENTVTSDDGTVLLRTAWTLPRLTAQNADGAALVRGEERTALSPAEQRGLAVCDTFNNTMTELLSSLQEQADELTDMAQSDIATRKELEASGKGFGEFIPYAAELKPVSCYQTDTLVSVCALAYTSSGGAHPNALYHVWNFDLTSGEFLTYEDFAAEESTFRAAVSGEIMDQIIVQGLYELYYDDYEMYVENLAYASVYFDADGMTVLFDEYTMGPHAAGTPTFFVSYGVFADLLSARALALLQLPQEMFLLADFFHARELWELFNLCTLPADYSSSVAMDDTLYCRVAAEDISSLADLRAMLCEYISEELADAWIADGPYLELDGALYTAAASRARDLTLGSERFCVTMDESGGEVTATVTRIIRDDETGDAVGVAEEVHSFPFVLQNGSAVFTAFGAYW